MSEGEVIILIVTFSNNSLLVLTVTVCCKGELVTSLVIFGWNVDCSTVTLSLVVSIKI